MRSRRWGAGVLAAALLAAVMCMPVMAATKLGETEEAYWDENHMGVARWKKVDNAKEYEVRLYEGDDQRVTTVNVSGTRADLKSYMADERWYSFAVRAVPKSNQKKISAGEWVRSEEIQAEGLGDTSGKWKTYSDGKKYQDGSGNFVTDRWYQIKGEWYRFDGNGFCLTGWQQIDTKWYYLNSEGIMQTGWLEIDGSRYYLESDGSMAVGWRQDKPGEWYYLDADGRMVTNTVVDGCQLDGEGKWLQ